MSKRCIILVLNSPNRQTLGDPSPKEPHASAAEGFTPDFYFYSPAAGDFATPTRPPFLFND